MRRDQDDESDLKKAGRQQGRDHDRGDEASSIDRRRRDHRARCRAIATADHAWRRRRTSQAPVAIMPCH
jgi:hypothetical protein